MYLILQTDASISDTFLFVLVLESHFELLRTVVTSTIAVLGIKLMLRGSSDILHITVALVLPLRHLKVRLLVRELTCSWISTTATWT